MEADGAVHVSALDYLEGGTLRISAWGENYSNRAVWDSKDNGDSWKDADADMSLVPEDGYAFSREGEPYVYNGSEINFPMGDGAEAKTIHAEEGETIYSVAISADTVAVVFIDEESWQLRAKVYDLRTMECMPLENQELAGYLAAVFETAGGQIALDSTGTVLYIEGAGIVRYDLAGDEFSYLIGQDEYDKLRKPENENGLVNSIGSLDSFAVNDTEDQVFLSIWNSLSEQSKLYRCEWGAWKEEQEAPKETLRIYSLKQSSLVQAATLFQEKHPELEVTFEVGYTGEDGVTLSDAAKALNHELAAGGGPDILVLDGLPADHYVEKGILEDVTDIVEPEKEKYFYNIVSSCNKGDTVYQVPTDFRVPFILGDKEVIAAKNREELMEVMKKKAGSGVLFTTSKNLAEAAVELFLTSDIREETVDEKKLAEYYRDLETFADLCILDGEDEILPYFDKMAYWAEMYPDAGTDPELNLYFDKAQAGIEKMGNLGSFIKILAVCKEKSLSYQYLNRENGNYFIPMNVLGINRGGKNKDAAEQFLRYYLSGEAQSHLRLPNISIIRDITEDDKYISESGEYAGGISGKYTPDEIIHLHKVTPGELGEYVGFLEELDTPVKDDAVVLQKVMEQADACVFDGKDPEKAAKDACKEVNLYLAEQ